MPAVQRVWSSGQDIGQGIVPQIADQSVKPSIGHRQAFCIGHNQRQPRFGEQIAQRCGYRSVESFRVAFRSVVGVPPSVYRERFGRSNKLSLHSTAF